MFVIVGYSGNSCLLSEISEEHSSSRGAYMLHYGGGVSNKKDCHVEKSMAIQFCS